MVALFRAPADGHADVRVDPDRRGNPGGVAGGAVGDHGGGAARLARLKAIVCRLVAIEELAGLDVLCSDKTGTLTKNELEVGSAGGAGRAATSTSCWRRRRWPANEDSGDAIDGAVLAGCGEACSPLRVSEHFVPFDPVHKRTGRTGSRDQALWVTKGAPQVVLQLGKPDAATRNRRGADRRARARG